MRTDKSRLYLMGYLRELKSGCLHFYISMNY